MYTLTAIPNQVKCNIDSVIFECVRGGLYYEPYKLWLAAGNTPLPADPAPNPAIAEIDAKLSAIDLKSIRSIREGDAAFIATLTEQAIELRTARVLLPKMM